MLQSQSTVIQSHVPVVRVGCPIEETSSFFLNYVFLDSNSTRSVGIINVSSSGFVMLLVKPIRVIFNTCQTMGQVCGQHTNTNIQ